MGKLLLKKLEIFSFAFIYIILIESIIRAYLEVSIIPHYFMMDYLYYVLLLSPIFLLKSNLFSRIYSDVIILIFCFLFILNIIYFKSAGTIFYVGVLRFLEEAKAVISKEHIKWGVILVGIGLLIAYIVIQKVIDHFYKDPIYSGRYFLHGSMLFLTIITSSLVLKEVTVEKYYKDSSTAYNANNGYQIINYVTQTLRKSAFNNFGMLTFYLSDYSVTYNNGETATIIAGDAGDAPVDTVNPDFYYPEENAFTGLLNGYNVFAIMIETGIYDAINEYMTPNLYNLQSNGINFSNNYSKNKTADSEIIGITGSYPLTGINYNYRVEDDDSIYKLKINTPYAVPTLLKETYQTSFFHDGVRLYARNNLMGQFGFEYWLHEFNQVHSGVSEWAFNGSYEMDSDYMDIILRDYADELYSTSEPFYTFWTTLSTHGPYTTAGYPAVEEKLEVTFVEKGYIEKFENYYDEVFYPLYGNLKETNNNLYLMLEYFMCCYMNLDESVGKLINELKENNEFDTTLFIIYGDHEAYYNNLSKSLCGATSSEDVSQYHTSLIFYNEDLTSKYREIYNVSSDKKCEVKTFTSPYIIVPTLLDLLGYDYDEKYYYSLSYFDFTNKYDGIFYSGEYSSFFTDSFYSTSPGTYQNVDSSITKEELDYITKKVTLILAKLTSLNEYYKEWFYY